MPLLYGQGFGLVSWNVFTDNIGAGAVIGGIASAVAASLPAAMLYLRRSPSIVEQPRTKPEIKLPAEVRPSTPPYDRIRTGEKPGRRRIIDESVLQEIEERINEVIRLLSADITN